MREMVVANRNGVGLNARRDIEVGIRHHFGLATGMNQEARVTVPLYEIVAQRRALAGTNLSEVPPLLK